MTADEVFDVVDLDDEVLIPLKLNVASDFRGKL
jgi:hypothetical protein